MIITASASHLPHTPRKLRLVADAVRGKEVEEILQLLQFTPKRAAATIIKTIKQAKANAVNNLKQTDKTFIIREIFVTSGRKLKRYRIGARGRYKPYAKLTSHLTIKLEAKEVGSKSKSKSQIKTKK